MDNSENENTQGQEIFNAFLLLNQFYNSEKCNQDDSIEIETVIKVLSNLIFKSLDKESK